MSSLDSNTFLEEDEPESRVGKRKQMDAEKLDFKSKELDVKSKELDIKLKEAENKKRIRDITYEGLDKAVERLVTLSTNPLEDQDVEAILKAKYRQMIEDA